MLLAPCKYKPHHTSIHAKYLNIKLNDTSQNMKININYIYIMISAITFVHHIHTHCTHTYSTHVSYETFCRTISFAINLLK